MSFYINTRSLGYQQHCLTRPVVSSVVMGGLFTGMSMSQGARLTPQLALTNMGGLYLYHIMQCPMEAVHGRPSALHNALSGGILGYVGVASGQLGIPFLDSYFFYRNPQIPAPLVGAAVYSGIAFILAAVLGGKPV